MLVLEIMAIPRYNIQYYCWLQNMKLPGIFNGKPSSSRKLNPELGKELDSRAETKLDLLSLPEEERIRVCKEIRGALQGLILERTTESISLNNAGH